MFLDWITKLSDRSGNYELFIKCEKCGHHRHASPLLFARIVGQDGLLVDLRGKLRCSKCNAREPLVRALNGRYAERD